MTGFTPARVHDISATTVIFLNTKIAGYKSVILEFSLKNLVEFLFI